MLPWLSRAARTHTLVLALSLTSTARTTPNDTAFEPLSPQFPTLPPTLSLPELPSSTLTARGSTLIRTRDGIETPLTCTLPTGPGTIHDLALDPAGLTFIAAEHDVFVLSPDVDAFDPLRWRDGAPTGTPTSIHVDSRRRVWIATHDAIGVVDPSFYWGRTLTPADGLPTPGPYRISSDSTGALLVATPTAVHRYHPDRGPKPTVTSLTLDGQPWRADSLVTKTYGDELAITAHGTAAGGATFRYRIDGHHIWRELTPTIALEKVSPGQHTLDVIAIDRDLRRSNPARVKLAIAYPAYYDRRVLVPAAMGLSALTMALFLVRAKRRGLAWGRGFVSACVALVLGAQVAAGLVPHAKGWPFIGFSMYTNTYSEGSIIYDGVLTGLEADGSPRRLDFNALGHLADDRWQVLDPIIDGGAPVAREWVEAFNARYPGARLAGLQARADRRRLTPTGAVRIAPLIFSSYVHEAAHGER